MAMQIEPAGEATRGKYSEEGFDMKIEVVGPGCRFCRGLHQRVEEVVREKGVGAEVVHVTDLGTAVPVKKVISAKTHLCRRASDGG